MVAADEPSRTLQLGYSPRHRVQPRILLARVQRARRQGPDVPPRNIARPLLELPSVPWLVYQILQHKGIVKDRIVAEPRRRRPQPPSELPQQRNAAPIRRRLPVQRGQRYQTPVAPPRPLPRRATASPLLSR